MAHAIAFAHSHALDRLGCGTGDGQLAVAIVHPDPHAPTPGNWSALCGHCLDLHRHDPGFYHVRFRDDRDLPDTDRPLKLDHGTADNRDL